MALLQSERIAAISTPLGPDVLVLESFSGSEELGRPFEFTAELRSEDLNISAEDLIGKPVSVRLNTANGGKRFFHGHVSRFQKTNKEGIHQSYSATIVPWTWFLRQTSNCRIFQKKSIPDILKEVFQGHGFGDFELRLSGEHTPWDYCTQYRESDLDFINRLAEQEGIYYYFRHEEQKHTMVLCDSAGAHEPFSHYESVSFRPPGQHGADPEHIREWISETRHRPGKFAHTDYDFTRPKTNLQARAQITEPYAFPNLEVYDYPGEYDQASDGEAWARIRMEEINSRVEVKSGWADARGLCVGSKFKLTEHPDPSAEGKYLVAATQITLDTGVYQTGELGGGEVFTCQFKAISADKTFRPERRTQKHLIQGLQTAVVTGPKGEEIYTDKHGQIKVQFHWDREGKFDENSSCWIRVAQVWAGKGWGGINIPRIGQEVVVAFLEGDPDAPLVIGSVYNGEQKPPFELPGAMVVSGLKSNTHKGKGYNEMSMNDTAGKEKITIHAQYDMNTTVKHDQTDLVQHDRKITVDGTHTETIKKETKITITEGPYSHKVAANTASHTANKEITIVSQTAHIHVTAATQIKLEVGASKLLMQSNGQIELTGTAIAINGSKSVSIYGGNVTSEAKALNHTIGATVVSDASTTNTINGKAAVMLNPL
jgi:type VI secretion system secreted protein VgrG